MSFIKRIFRKLGLGRTRKQEEVGDTRPVNTAATHEEPQPKGDRHAQTYQTNTKAHERNGAIHQTATTNSYEPMAESSERDDLPQEPKSEEPVWERVYYELSTDLREEYTSLLEEEWIKQNGAGQEADEQTKRDFLIQHGLGKLGEDQTPMQRGLAHFSSGIEIVRGFVDQAVKVSPEASLAWAGFCVVLPLLTNIQDASDAIEEAFGYSTKGLGYYLALEKRLKPEKAMGENRAHRHDLLKELYQLLFALLNQMLELQMKSIIRLYRRNLIKNMLAMERWQEMIDAIKKDEAAFTHKLEQAGLHHIQESLDKSNEFLRDLLRLRKESLQVQKEHRNFSQQTVQMQKSKINNRHHQVFRLAQESQDVSYENSKARIREREEGTCQWFLSHRSYTSWLDKPKYPLIVSAPPGSGKSVLAKYLVDSSLEGRKSKDTLCYFFFDRQQGQSTVRQAVCALIHQVISQRPQAIAHVVPFYERSGDKLANVVPDLWTIFKSMVIDDEVGRVIIILDALDECDESEIFIEHFIKMSLAISSEPEREEKFTFLVTARPYPHIMSRFHNTFRKNASCHISAAEFPQDIASEVNNVVRARATALVQDEQLDPDLKDYLVSGLQQKTQRTYLWIHLIFEYLRAYDSQISKDTIDDVMKSSPEQLDVTYDKMIGISKRKALARKVFSIILAAYRPLTLQEMHIALNSLPSEQPQPLKNLELYLPGWCGLLVTITNNKVYLLHDTTREFLISKGFSGDRETGSGPISEMECHEVLARSCMSYLDVSILPALLRSKDEREFIDEGQDFLTYVAENWSSHIQRAQLDDDKDFVTTTRRLCDPDDRLFQLWIESSPPRLGGSYVDLQDTNLLWVASLTGMTALVRQILEEEDTCDTRNRDGQNTLLIAALRGNHHVLQLLLDSKKIRTDLRDAQRRGPLQAAVESQNPAAVQVLLNSGEVDVSTWEQNGQTPFEWAMSYCGPEMIEVFVDSSPDEARNSRNSVDKTPLMIACEWKVEQVFWGLIKPGRCDVNAQDHRRRTALTYSTLFGDEEFVEALLKLDETIADIRDLQGKTPLIWAAELGHGTILKGLIGSGKADVRAIDNFGRTALHQAAASGHCNTIEILFAELAVSDTPDEDAPDSQGWTPLMSAAFKGYKEAVRQLCKNQNVNPNRRNENGTTALFKAANRGHLEVVRTLLEYSADPNIPDEEGCTALMIAAFQGHTEVVSLLLGWSDAKVTAKDKEGRDAMWYADLRNNLAINELLRIHKATTMEVLYGNY